MHKMLMIGVMLLGMLSCKAPTFKKPLKMYAVNQKFNEAGVGFKNLNYKLKDKSKVGEWVTDPAFIPLHEAPNNMMCFSTEDWLKKVKPKLKEAHDYYFDQ